MRKTEKAILPEDIIPLLEERVGEKVYQEYVVIKTISSRSYEHFFERMMLSVPDSALSLSFQDFLGKPLAMDFSFRRNLFQGARKIEDKTGYVEEMVLVEARDALRGLTASCAATFRSTPPSLEEMIKETARKHGVTLTEGNISSITAFLRPRMFANQAAGKMVAELIVQRPPRWGEKVLEIADAVESYNFVKRSLIGSAIADTRRAYTQKTEELAGQGNFLLEHPFRRNNLFDKVYQMLKEDNFFSSLFMAAEPFTLYSSEYGLGYNSIKYFKSGDIPRLIRMVNRNKHHLLPLEERLKQMAFPQEDAPPSFDASTFLQEAERFRAECKHLYKKTMQDRFVEHPQIGEPCYTASMVKWCFKETGPAAQKIREYARREGKLIHPRSYGIPSREKDTLYIPKSVVARLIEKHNFSVTLKQLEKAYGF